MAAYEGRKQKDAGAAGVVAVVGAAIGAVVAFAALGYALQLGDGDEPQAVTEVAEGAVSTAQFRAIEIGTGKEEVLATLRPALPVDTAVLDRYDQRSPETVAESCVYFETEAGPREELFRFCFDGDELVDKTVVLPDEPAVSS